MRSLRPILKKLGHFENVKIVYGKRRNFQNLLIEKGLKNPGYWDFKNFDFVVVQDDNLYERWYCKDLRKKSAIMEFTFYIDF